MLPLPCLRLLDKHFLLPELDDCGLIDLCVVVDSSGSIRDRNPRDNAYDNWELVRGFVREVSQLRINIPAAIVALV